MFLVMATKADFKELAKQHIKTADILMKAGDYSGAAYILGYVLEFYLKAATCKTLNIISYPETHANDKVYGFFKTHSFDQLLIVSGMSDLIDPFATDTAPWQNWSDFTSKYLGEWTGMRYNKDKGKEFTKSVVENLYRQLLTDDKSIVKTITNKKRC